MIPKGACPPPVSGGLGLCRPVLCVCEEVCGMACTTATVGGPLTAQLPGGPGSLLGKLRAGEELAEPPRRA